MSESNTNWLVTISRDGESAAYTQEEYNAKIEEDGFFSSWSETMAVSAFIESVKDRESALFWGGVIYAAHHFYGCDMELYIEHLKPRQNSNKEELT